MQKITRKQVLEQIQKYGSENEVIAAAMEILRGRMAHRVRIGSPAEVREYLAMNLQGKEYEVVWTVYLDSQNRVIAAEEAFRGSLTQTSVYPREIVKRALAVNAAAVIFAHNHPSGIAHPSRADEMLTQQLKHALAFIDVKVLDHFIIGHGESMSFAERGLL